MSLGPLAVSITTTEAGTVAACLRCGRALGSSRSREAMVEWGRRHLELVHHVTPAEAEA